ncbi:hypothetical protein M3Y99_01896300 [Aphelenchoides fujianensis]|nr:hypothetical protein M3Y99_01896300 [Aphelenchoides fujianensis]
MPNLIGNIVSRVLAFMDYDPFGSNRKASAQSIDRPKHRKRSYFVHKKSTASRHSKPSHASQHAGVCRKTSHKMGAS